MYINEITIARDNFEERKAEIQRYLDFTEALIDKKANTLARTRKDSGEVESIFPIERSLTKTLSATAYLLIYNLIESTMTHALDSIHQQVRNKKLTFEKLSEPLKSICIKNFREAVTSKIAHSHGETLINEALTWMGYDKKKLFSGNIDAKIIQEKARSYGFKIADHDKSKSQDGIRMKVIRVKRNELSHGNISFEQCGQDTAIDDVIKLYKESSLYLEAVLDGVERYLKAEEYQQASN
ncbi:MAE_28990/MAE_18760 family HEPN-like nuclease [Microbulbifer sp. VTAC004]|uniref:MAE_28990/MAE_18760 family HEPN-like nuclease n=1 Tax=Microbulbifer sp. VTAC004 TaxID=3243386 RepID=UPI0040390263